jgi:hypothetical protein
MADKCNEIVSDVFGVQEIASSTYLQNMSTQVDTAIRRNYVRIPGSEITLKKRPNKQSYKKSSFRARRLSALYKQFNTT